MRREGSASERRVAVGVPSKDGMEVVVLGSSLRQTGLAWMAGDDVVKLRYQDTSSEAGVGVSGRPFAEPCLKCGRLVASGSGGRAAIS
jgi:hypothetical protein